MSNIRCTYRRIFPPSGKNYWISSCGFKLTSINKHYKFCPCCGRPILRAI